MDYLDIVKSKAKDSAIFREYRFDAFIGRGGYGRVYEAFCHLYQKKYAVKIYAKSEKSDSRSNSLQRNEADLLKRVRHKNIIKIYEYIETKYYIFVITELCEGGDLWKALETFQNKFSCKAMPEKLVAQIVKQIIEGLLYLKEVCIIHRDMKPGSLCLTRQYPYKEFR